MEERSKLKLLVVDDEPAIRDSLRLLLQEDYDVSTAEDGEQALLEVESRAPDLILLDLMMPKLDGMETLKQLNEKGLSASVIMLTAAGTVKSAVQAMKRGAVDFLSKPFDIDELKSILIATAERQKRPAISSFPTRDSKVPDADFGPMVGKSRTMLEVFNSVEQVACRDTTVLITGESGTGKELVARRIHELSNRKNGPFVAINCAAIPETLIESELFGHERGAFTHAVEKRLGHFELADGGTLFLDEIGELSPAVQVKMLRVLQEQEFYRVGKSKPVRVNVRMIAATNRDLEQLVKQGKFRQDLFYRINVINVRLPTLRDRYEDIPHLIEHFTKKLSAFYGGKSLSLSPEALEKMVSYDWPGNVRELENVIESLMAMGQSETIMETDLPRRVREPAREEIGESLRSSGGLGLEEAEKLFETELIMKALKKSNFVQTRAAEILGVSRRILKYKMDRLGITEKLEAGKAEIMPGAGDSTNEH